MTTFYIETNGIRHCVSSYGNGKEPLVFLHYLGGTKEIWQSLIPYFEKDYHILAIDLRGHGDTDQPKTGYNLADFSEDIKGILNTLGIQKAHFIGSSFGCDVALRLAHDYPEHILSLTFSEGAMINSSGPLGLRDETKEELLNRLSNETEERFTSWEDFYQIAQQKWTPWNESKAVYIRGGHLRRVEGGKWAMPTKQETVIQILDSLFDEALERYFTKVTCPVLFLPAEKENGLDKKLAFIRHVEPFLVSCQTHIIPGTTHTMMFDEPEEMARIIKEKGLIPKVNL